MDLSTFHMRRQRRIAAVLGALVLTVGAAACGGEDEEKASNATQGSASIPGERQGGAVTNRAGGDGPGANGERERPPAGPSLSGDVEEARKGVESVDGVYEGFAAAVEDGISSARVPARETLDDARDNEALSKVCDLMSEEARQQTITYAKRSSGIADVEWNCENATGLLLRRASQSGGLKRVLRVKVIGVNTDGDNATASVRFGRKGTISTIPLVKEDGEWKLAASPSGGGGE